MMANVKEFMSDLGDQAQDLAKWLGGADLAKQAKKAGNRSADFAKDVGSRTADLAKDVGSRTADLAKDLGGSAKDLAKQVGPKRGLIGLAVFGAAIAGTVMLVRYLRAQSEAEELSADELALNEEAQHADPHRRHKLSRAKRKAANTMTH